MPTQLFTHACGHFRAGSAPTKAPLLPQDAANVSQVRGKWSFQTLCADSIYLYTHLAAPHHYDARHFKNDYPVTGNGIHLLNTMMSLWRLTEHQHKPGISKEQEHASTIHPTHRFT